MKKKMLVVVVALVMGAAGLSAQEAGQFSVGFRAGGALGFNRPEAERFGRVVGNFANIPIPQGWGWAWDESSRAPRHELEPNLTFALYGNFAVTSSLSVQAELSFMINQGYELIFSSPTLQRPGSQLVDVNLTTLDLPVLLRYNFLDSPAAFGIQAGPHVSIPLRSLEVYEDREDDSGFREWFDIATSATFGLTAGFFCGFALGPGRVVGDLRFVFDFDTLEAHVPQAQGGTSREQFMRRRALVFTLGYEISL
ncbi:MAG: PorT family protein [Treponema sp.]|nr:PorT family protein [Treponema sp.]